jgi:hypothetical protein
MRVPIYATAFGGAYWIASLLQMKFFTKWGDAMTYSNPRVGGLQPGSYLNNHDLISKFRIFEAGTVANADAQNEVENYLDLYSSGPLTKAEMLNRFAEGKKVDASFTKNFKMKRMGKDKDNIFWAIGKIHGIENAGLCDLDELKATGGDPMQVQEIINKANDAQKPDGPGSFENAIQ